MIDLKIGKLARQSKGRNGWFNPVRVNLRTAGIGNQNIVNIEVWSKSQNGEPPIDLYLSSEDAELLGIALLRVAGRHVMPGRVEEMIATEVSK